MNSNHILWEDPRGGKAVCNVGIAGDFLPAMGLAILEGQIWRNMARDMAEHLKDVAVMFVNLETPVGCDHVPPLIKAELGQNLSAPAEALDYLLSIKANIVGLANNHMYDFGNEGLERTRQAIIERGIVPLGSGRKLKDAPEVFVWQGPDQVKVGFWAAAKHNSKSATYKKSGTEVATIDRAVAALEEMKRKGANCNIALLHAGLERTNRPDPEDVRLINLIAATGFDVVAACHSHRISGYGLTQQKLTGRPAFCFYGLGSLSSGCIYSALEREGIIVVIGLNNSGAIVSTEVRPVYLEGLGWGNMSSTQHATQAILRRVISLSAEIGDGSYQHLFYREISKGLISIHLRDAMAAYRKAGIKGVLQKIRRLRIRHLRHAIHKVID